MSNNKNYKYLVVEPGLSTVSFAQPLTAAKYAQVHAHYHTPQHPIIVVPYSPQLAVVLKMQKQKLSKSPSSLQNYMQAIGEEIKEEILQQKQHQQQVQHVNNLCAANSNVLSIFSKPKKHKPKPNNNSNTVVQLFPTK